MDFRVVFSVCCTHVIALMSIYCFTLEQQQKSPECINKSKNNKLQPCSNGQQFFQSFSTIIVH